MAKIKTYPITGVTDVAKMVTGVEKVIKILGLAQYLKVKAPRPEWISANVKDGKLTVEIDNAVDVSKGIGPIKVTAIAGNGTHSVMGVYNFKKEQFDVMQKNLKAAGLI